MIRTFCRCGLTGLLILIFPSFAYGLCHDFNLWTSHSKAGIEGGLIMAALTAFQFGVLVFISSGTLGVMRAWQPQEAAGIRRKPFMLAASAGIAVYMLIFAFETFAFQNGYDALYLLLSWHEQAWMALRIGAGSPCCAVQPDQLDLPVKLVFGVVVYALIALAAIKFARRDD
jgi:hypothetical protein